MKINELASTVRRAIEDYNMIEDGDKIAVGVSGGKDSMTLLCVLANLKKYYPKKFELIALNIDMGFNNVDLEEVENVKKLCAELEVELFIEKTDIARIVFEERKEKNPCSLCSKIRRGALNTLAISHNCNKIALGHHSDDLIETFFLSMFYEGRLSTFAPVSFMDRSKITLIRPMLYLEEKDIITFSKDLPIIHNPCPANKHTKREYIKNMLFNLKKDTPFVKERIFGAITSPDRYNLFNKFLDDIENLKKKD